MTCQRVNLKAQATITPLDSGKIKIFLTAKLNIWPERKI